MLNKELKKTMLKDGKYKAIKKADKDLYNNKAGIGIKDFLRNTGGDYDRIASISEMQFYLAKEYGISLSLKELESYIQLNDSKRQKGYKLLERLDWYTNQYEQDYKLVFATFTFNDEALKLNKKYRKELITRALHKNPNIVDYIGNIDFGSKNEREHYHYILIISPKFKPKTKMRTIKSKKTRSYVSVENLDIDYPKGFTTYELVGNDREDREKIKNYITKLTMHALKVDIGNKLIYRRESPYLQAQRRVQRASNEWKEVKEERIKKKKFTKIQEIEKELGTTIEDIDRLGGNLLWKN